MAVVFYGMESRDFIKKNLKKWSMISGNPEVFTLKDASLKKIKKKTISEYDFVSVDEALRRYPDAEFWITHSKESKAVAAGINLLKKMPPNKIHFLGADIEYRKGCSRLGKSFHYSRDAIPMCTMGNRKRPYIKTSDSIFETITQWQDYSKKLIYANQIGSPNRCLDCPVNKYGFWHRTTSARNLFFLQSLSDDSCNFRCIYCHSVAKRTWTHLKNADSPSTCDVLRQFSEMKEYVDMEEKFTISFANGEFCVNTLR